MNYICIECNEREHKYKDCPKVKLRENEQQNVSSSDNDLDDEVALDRIPKITPNTNPKPTPNKYPQPQQQPQQQPRPRITPSVQLINNSALSTLAAINNVNMMNMRNRMTVNNILMNAALHNAQRRAGGITPRIINSRLPQNAAAAAANPYALLQQQSLLSQQAALNRLRMNNVMQHNPMINRAQTTTNQHQVSRINMPQPNNNN